MKALLLLALTSLALAQDQKPPATPITDQHYRVYRADGTPSTLDQVITESTAASVTFLGELHDDPVAHHLEHQLFAKTWTPGLALSLEMFERDVQYILNEYLTGVITPEQFQASSRPWKNYRQDYKPLIEFAKEKAVPVIAANAPRRYVNRVSRLGAGSLPELGSDARRYLPPLPYPKPSPAYIAKFEHLMQENKEGGKPLSADAIAKRLEAQSLWDSSMAHSIADFMTSHPDSRVLHVSGSFHSAQRLGTVEQLFRYRPGVSVVVVNMIASDTFPNFDAATMKEQGDFVIVTDSKLPRSYVDPPAPAPVK